MCPFQAAGEITVREEIRVKISIPPLQRLEIMEKKKAFDYQGQALEIPAAAQLRVKSNSPWQLTVKAEPLEGQVAPQLSVKGTGEQYAGALEVTGREPGITLLTIDAYLPASDLSEGKYSLDLYFQLSSL